MEEGRQRGREMEGKGRGEGGWEWGKRDGRVERNGRETGEKREVEAWERKGRAGWTRGGETEGVGEGGGRERKGERRESGEGGEGEARG